MGKLWEILEGIIGKTKSKIGTGLSYMQWRSQATMIAWAMYNCVWANLRIALTFKVIILFLLL